VHDHNRDLYVTSFWCKERATAVAWVRRFKRRVAQLEAEMLKPLGLQLSYRLEQPI
jgi:hypothetical protein